MLQSEKIFGNLFSDIRITPPRLSNFTIDTISRLNNVDVSGLFKPAIIKVIAAHTPFHDGLSEIDTSLGERKGKIKNVNEVRAAIGLFMTDYESEIARALGGRDTTSFIMFYPKGKTEYKRATKGQMPLLVKRIASLATDNAAALGDKLTQQIQSFETLWQAALEEESNVNSNLSDGRSDRNTLRYNLEMALLNVIHLVASEYPGDVAKCNSFFNFKLLMGAGRKAAAAVVPTPPAMG